jgi:fibronectin-binding autotransporter adhesin
MTAASSADARSGVVVRSVRRRWLVSVAAICVAATAFGQTTVYWDTNGSTAGSSGATTASGTWDDATTANWTTSAAGTTTAATWTGAAGGNKIAVFSAGSNATGASTVTVSGTINNLAGITFSVGSTQITGGTALALGADATIDGGGVILTPITGAFGLTKTGGGILGLGAANTLSGAVAVNSGEMLLANNGTLASAASYALSNGGTLTLDNTTTNNGNRLSSGAITTTGGTLNFTHSGSAATNYSETAGALTVNSGGLTINLSQAAVGQTSTFTLSSFTRGADGSVLFSGTGLGAGTRNQVILSTAPTLNNGILKGAIMTADSGATYNLVTHSGVNGTAITPYASYATGSETTWTATTVNARPAADQTLTANRSLNSLTLDNGIDLLGPSADRTITFGAGATILQTGGTSNIGVSGNNEYILAFGGNEAIFAVYGTLNLSRGNTNGITGTAGLIKTGTGTVVSSMNSTNTGGLTINEGTWRALTNAGAVSGGGLVGNGGTLELASGGNVTWTNTNTSVNGDFTIVSDRSAANAGATQTLGTLTIGSNALTVRPGANVTSGTAAVTFATSTTLAGNPTFNVDNGSQLATLTLPAIDDGGTARAITKTGTGTLTVSSAATSLVDGTAINVALGTLNSNNASALGALANVTVDTGATLNLGASQTLGALNGLGNVKFTNSFTLTLGGTNNLDSDFGGVISNTSGTGTVIKTGTGSVIFSGVNTYAGTTTVNRGFLGLSGSGAISAANLSLTSTGSGGAQFGMTGTFSRGFGIGAGQVQLAGANGAGFVAYGGNLTLSGMTGTWGTTTGFFSASTGPLIFNDATHANGMIDWTSTFSLGTAARTITVNDNASSTADWARISGVITTGVGGSLVKNGAGMLELTANNSATATTITVNEGVLGVTGSGQLFGGNLSLAGTTGSAPAVLATSGTFSRAIGTGNNQVQFSGANGAGFSAYGGALNLTGLAGATWGAGNFFSASTGPLVFGDDVFSNNVVNWQGSFSLGTLGRTITVIDNPNSAADYAKISGVISSGVGASLTKNGTGLLQLAAANTYSGATTVAAGTLQYGINDALPTTTALTISSGATLDLSSFNGTVGSLAGAGNVDVSAASVSKTLTVGDTTSTIFSGVLGNSGSGSTLNLVKEGSGALTLSNTNTYGGTTTINAGTLKVSSDGNLGTAPGSTVANSLTLGGGTLEVTSGFTLASNRGITLTANKTSNITADTNQLLNYGGVITGSGNIVFGTVTTGTGAISLSNAANNYSGTTTIDAGSLRFGVNNALPTATALTINVNGTLDLFTFNGQIGSLSGAGTVDLSQIGQTKTLTAGDSNSTNFSGTITDSGAGSALSLLKLGSGTLTLSGSNFYTGSTTIQDGTLKISADSGLGTAPGLATAGHLTLSGGTLEVAASTTLNSNRGVALTAATTSNITADNSQTLALGGIVAGSGNIVYGTAATGTGTVTLSGTNTNTGTTTLAAGTVSVGTIGNGGVAGNLGQASNAAGNLVFDGGALQYTGATASTDRNFTLNSGKTATIDVTNAATTLTMSGSTASATSGGLTKNGSGNLTLTGTNLYTGATTVNGGTLFANGVNSIGDSTGSVTVTAGTLSLGSGSFTKSGGTSLSGGGATATTGALHAGGGTGTTSVFLSDITLTGNTTFTAADSLLQVGNGSTFTSTLALGGHTLTLYTPSAATVTPIYPFFNPYVFDNSNIVTYSKITNGSLEKTGTGTATIFAGMAGGNTFIGDTNISGGTLIVDGGTNRPAINSNQIYVGNSSTPGSADTVVLQMGQYVSPPAGNNLIGTWNSGTNGSTSSITIYEDGLFNMNKASNGFVDITLRGGHITGRDSTQNPNLTFTGTLHTVASAQTAVIEQGNLRISGNGLIFNIEKGTTSSGVDLRIDDVVQTWTNGIFGYTAGSAGTGLSKTGIGLLALTNNNSYAGITDITAGVLRVQNSGALGQTGSSLTDTGNGTIVRNNAQLQLQSITTDLAISGFEALTLNGNGGAGNGNSGALRNVAGDNTYNGFVYLNSASRINADSGTTLTIANSTGVNSNIMDGVTAGQALTVGGAGNTMINGGIANKVGAITKDGNGTLTLAGTNTYTGATTISGGAVKITNSDGLSGTGVTVAANTALQFAQGAGSTDINVANVSASIQGTGISNGGAIQNLSGTNSYAGQVTLTDDALITANAGSALTLSGGTTGANKALTIGSVANYGNIEISGTVANGTGALTKEGAGTFTLSGAATTVGTVAMNGGILNFNSATTTTGIVNVTSGVVNFNGTTGSTGAVHMTGGNVTVASTMALATGNFDSLSGTTLTIASGGTVTSNYASNGTFAGEMAGSGTFVKTGAGALTLNNGFVATGLNLTLSGGTMAISGDAFNIGTLTLGGGTLSLSNAQFTAQTIHITGNTILDFNNSAGTFLSSATLLIDNGVTVTINNWITNANAASASIWYVTNNINGTMLTGSDFGGGNLPNVTFTGYPGYQTTWISGTFNPGFFSEIRPTPEPATYGLIFLSGTLGLLAGRRWLRRKAVAPAAPTNS